MNATNRPPQIANSHLARTAVVYVRQSTEHQVLHNVGSTAAQRAQAEFAKTWGWPVDRIVVLDDDLGLSGSAAAHRKGYLQLRQRIERGNAGIVLASDISRLGRDPIELFDFLALCQRHDVLVALSGRIQNLRDSGDMFTQQIISTVVHFENQRRHEMMRRGVIAKLHQGNAVSRPPAGYVTSDKGQWELDPDPEVQLAVRAVFEEYLRNRSLHHTVRALNARKIRIPGRVQGARAKVSWRPPAAWRILAMLRNPAYRGDYVYFRNRADPSLPRMPCGQVRTRINAPTNHLVLPGHHDAYVSRQEWDEVQSIADRYRGKEGRPNLGSGTAILQGVIVCSVHGRTMSPHYSVAPKKATPSHGYACVGDYPYGGRGCGRIHGAPADEAVIKAVCDRLSPPGIEEIRKAWLQRKRDTDIAHRRRRAAVERVKKEVDEIAQRALHVDRANMPRVARKFDEELEARQKHLEKLEREVAGRSTGEPVLTDAHLAGLLSISASVRQILDAPTTRPSDIKELIRLLIKKVIVADRRRTTLDLRIVWADGAADILVQARRPLFSTDLMRRLHREGKDAEEIAAALNWEGLRTKMGQEWTARRVKQALDSWRSWERKKQPHRPPTDAKAGKSSGKS